MKLRSLCYMSLALWMSTLWLAASVVRAHSEPALVSDAWQLDFTHDLPQPIAVVDINGQYRWYWYIAYKVVNHSGEDQVFVPEVTIATDNGAVTQADQGVPAMVFEAIQQRVGNPLLESPSQIIGPILQGPDHAKEGVIIWAAPEEDVDQISVFITGLSGETQTIPNPVTQEPVLLRKTLMIEYATPGSNMNLQNQPILEKSRRWIMR